MTQYCTWTVMSYQTTSIFEWIFSKKKEKFVYKEAKTNLDNYHKHNITTSEKSEKIIENFISIKKSGLSLFERSKEKKSELATFIEKHLPIMDLKENWNGEGAKAIQKSIFESALTILKEVFEISDTATLGLWPNYDGSLDISWRNEFQDVLITIFPDNKKLYVIYDNVENFHINGVYDSEVFRSKILPSY